MQRHQTERKKPSIPNCTNFATSIHSSYCLCFHPYMTFVCNLVLPYYCFLVCYVYSPSSSYYKVEQVSCVHSTHFCLLLPENIQPEFYCHQSIVPITSQMLHLLLQGYSCLLTLLVSIILVSSPNPCFVFLDSLSSHDSTLILFYPLIPTLKT